MDADFYHSLQVIVREVTAASVMALMLAAVAFARVMLTKGAPLQMGIILAVATYATVTNPRP